MNLARTNHWDNFRFISGFEINKKVLLCGVQLGSLSVGSKSRCIYKCLRADECSRVWWRETDSSCRLIGHDYSAGAEICANSTISQWIKDKPVV